MKNTFIFFALIFCPLVAFSADSNNTSTPISKEEEKKLVSTITTKDPWKIRIPEYPKPRLPEELRAKKKN